jgi:hypothetical protein
LDLSISLQNSYIIFRNIIAKRIILVERYMKILQVLVLILGFVYYTNAQVDCITENKVYVYDSEGQLIKNAKLEVFEVSKNGKKNFAFMPQKVEADAYIFISYLGSFNGVNGKTFLVGDNYLKPVHKS